MEPLMFGYVKCSYYEKRYFLNGARAESHMAVNIDNVTEVITIAPTYPSQQRELSVFTQCGCASLLSSECCIVA